MSDNMPLLSIVLVNYNYGRYIEDAIKSVVTQDAFSQCELIIVDGGSTDNSIEIIRKYADKVSWWVSEKDSGQSNAFNKGFSHGRGKYFVWLNSDDMLLPGSLRAFLKAVRRHPSCQWFVGSCAYMNEYGVLNKAFLTHRFSTLRAKYITVSVGGPSSFFAAEMFNRVGGFDENLCYTMDTDLWYKFYRLAGAKFIRLRELIFAFRIHAESKTSASIVSSNEKAILNHEMAMAECELMRRRYCNCCIGTVWQKFILGLTFSPVDKLVSIYRTIRCKGKRADE